MPSCVKIVNGSEHVFEVAEAARRLRGLGLRVSEIQPLGIPYEIEFPFITGAASPDRSMILEIKGTYRDLLALEREVN